MTSQRNMINNSKNGKTLFVTVGSTKFEQLINRILEADLLNLLKVNSIKKIILQVGNGVHEHGELLDLNDSTKEATKFYRDNIEITAYRYKSTIREDLASADIVISHAGAGSILESLEANKKLIVVVNEKLMNNHQFELAEKMFDLGYLLFTTCDGLLEKIELINNKDFTLNKYTPGLPALFGDYLNKLTF
jgi:beta-1,4-N-acetylglucosaminyltransferase